MQGYGDMAGACRSLGVDLMTVVNWREADPEVESRLHKAELVGWSSLESVAIQRAVHGVEEDVYFQGDVVGQKINYSDGLLTKLLTARNKAYQPKEEASTAMTVNVAIMPRADTYDAWLEHRASALGAKDPDEIKKVQGKEVLPAPAIPQNLKDLDI